MARRFKKPPARKERLAGKATAPREAFGIVLLLAFFVALVPLVSVRLGLRLLASESEGANWVGVVSSDWNNRQNWFPAKVPTESTEVTIDITKKSPVLGTNGVIRNLTVRQGAILTLNGKDLKVLGRLTNQGTIRVKCRERVDVAEWVLGGTWEFVSLPSLAPVTCPIDGGRPYDNIVINPDKKRSVSSTFMATGGTLSVRGKLTIKNGILATDGTNISVGTLHNEAVFRMRGDETVTVGTFVMPKSAGSGTWVIAGRPDGKPDVFTLRAWHLSNVVFAPGDPDEKFIIANGTNVHRSLEIRGGTVSVQASTTLSGGMLRVNGGTLRGAGTLTFEGGLRLDSGSYIMTGSSEHRFGKLLMTGGEFRGGVAQGILRVQRYFFLLRGSLSPPATLAVGGDLFFGKGTFEAGLGTTVLEGKKQSIFGTPIFQSLTKIASLNDTLSLQPGTLLTVKGALTLQGGTRGTLSLRSQSPGKQWILDARGKKTLDHLKVTDGKNAGTKSLTCSACKDGGNNTGWTFTQ